VLRGSTTPNALGQFFAADGSGLFNITANRQQVFSQTFPNIDFKPRGERAGRLHLQHLGSHA